MTCFRSVYSCACVWLKQDHTLGPHNTQRGRRGFIARGSSALMLHVVRPGGARLHDFWQQARIRVQTSVNGGQCSARRGRRGHSYFLVLDGLASARGGQKPGRPCLGAPLRACLSRIVRYRMAPRSQGLFAVVSTGKKGKKRLSRPLSVAGPRAQGHLSTQRAPPAR